MDFLYKIFPLPPKVLFSIYLMPFFQSLNRPENTVSFMSNYNLAYYSV